MGSRTLGLAGPAFVPTEFGSFLNSCVIRNRATGAGETAYVRFTDDNDGDAFEIGPGDAIIIKAEDTSVDTDVSKITCKRCYTAGNVVAPIVVDILWTCKSSRRMSGVNSRTIEV